MKNLHACLFALFYTYHVGKLHLFFIVLCFLGENSRGSPYCGIILLNIWKKNKEQLYRGTQNPKERKGIKKLYTARLGKGPFCF
jgi:hypothetical protein